MDGCFMTFRNQGRMQKINVRPGWPLCDSRDQDDRKNKPAAMDGCFVIFAIKDERIK
jgi:hypothetical protein